MPNEPPIITSYTPALFVGEPIRHDSDTITAINGAYQRLVNGHKIGKSF